MIATALLGLLVLSAYSLNSLRANMLQEKEVQLTKLTDTLFSQLFLYEQKIKEGQLSQAQAQQQAVAYIKTLRYGQGDYFWINDHQPKMIMHPTNPKLDGQDLSTNQDKVGNFLFVDMVKAVKENAAGGFVHYFWPKPNSDTPVEKLSYVREFAPWGWIIGTGIYIDDINAQFIEKLKSEVAVIALILLVVIFMGGLLVRSLKKAIASMTNQVSHVSREMHFSLRFEPRKDELDQVGQSLNGLLADLEKSINEANQVVNGIAKGEFNQRMQGDYIGDLATLKLGVNGSAESVAFSMNELAKVMQALYEGDFSARMDAKVPGEFRNLVQNAMTALDTVMAEINQVMHQMAQGDFTGQVKVSARGSLAQLKDRVNQAMDSMAHTVDAINGVVTAQAAGDLTRTLTGDGFKGQLQTLQHAMNDSTAKIKTVVNVALAAAEVVSGAAHEVSQGSLNLSERVQEQAAALEQTSSAIHQMSSQVQSTNDNAKQATQVSQQVQGKAHQGVEVMQQTLQAMQMIQDSSHQISEIVTLIDSIAFQTNLLALNAAVEAARAGEHGRGFAVVASEVRQLAQKSADAAKNIKRLIDQTVTRVNQGANLASESGGVLKEINESVRLMTQMITQIATASSEQAEGVRQVHHAIIQIDGATQQNAALVEETSAASESLNEQANLLQKEMAFFNTGHVARLN
jgi:methyl-accepting chemotaxis protein